MTESFLSEKDKYLKDLEEIYELKREIGLLDLRKFYSILDNIKNISSEYTLEEILDEVSNKSIKNLDTTYYNNYYLNNIKESYKECILTLHMRFGVILSNLEFKLNQVKIKTKLESLKTSPTMKFDINEKVDFKILDDNIVNLLNLNFRFSKVMAELVKLDLFSENNLRNDLEEKIEVLKKKIDKLMEENYNI